MIQNKRVVIFDMDGTLIDSVGVWNQVDIKMIKTLGSEDISLAEVQAQRDKMLRQFSKSPSPYHEYCSFLGAKYHSPLTPQELHKMRYDIAQKFLIESIDYKPWAEDVLNLLRQKGLILVIASTTQKANMDIYKTKNKNIIAKAKLDEVFSAIYTREDAKEIKPNPEIYLRVAKDLNLLPEECLVFEDSLIGLEAAKKAGMECAIIYDLYSDGERQQIHKLADYEFDDYKQVLELLQK